jgi:hypothetical protein
MLTAQLFAQLPDLKKTPGRPKFSCPSRGDLVRSTGCRGAKQPQGTQGTYLWALWLLLLSSMKKGLP